MARKRTPHDHKNQSLKQKEKFLIKAASKGGWLNVHLLYPNNYWIAMSNLGFQAVYRLFAETPGLAVERAFLPDDADLESETSWDLKTFESARPLSHCDVLAASLSFETDYLNFIWMLKQAKLLPDPSEDLDQPAFYRPLIIVGGTAVTLNAEPLGDFVDVVFSGEAEEFVPELTKAIEDAKKRALSRFELLHLLAGLEGVYVPRFYHFEYKSDGSVERVKQVEGPGTQRMQPQRRFVADISKYPTYSGILTSETEFRSMFLTETGRGCEMGCRFCVAGYIYRPIRKRSEESIAASVELGLQNSQAVGFVGAAVSSHKSIAKLAESVAKRGARASLSSIMSQRVTKELSASLSESEYRTVALAPEAGSERLRRAAGKRVSNNQVVEAARTLAEAGIKGFKLYFIVGLPTETDDDVDQIAVLAEEVRNAAVEASRSSGEAAWVSLSVNPFIPKAWTPFQWEPMVDLKELERKIDRLRKLTNPIPNVALKFEPPKESYFQALLSRGDRRVGKLLLHLVEQRKSWKWLVMQNRKREVIEGVPPLDFYIARRIPFEEILPWSIVDARIDPQLLKREALRAHLPEGGLDPAELKVIDNKVIDNNFNDNISDIRPLQ